MLVISCWCFVDKKQVLRCVGHGKKFEEQQQQVEEARPHDKSK